MTETQVIRLLARSCREKKLRFYAKVYAGRLYKSQERILDGMAFTQQYANMRTIGYESKVSRADFLQDKKWPEYLPVCNSFYFVCPAGIIVPADLPKEIGLIWVEGEFLRVIKPARRREINDVDLQNVLKSLVINRCESEREKVGALTRRLYKAEKALEIEKAALRKLHDSFYSLEEDIYMLTHPEENHPRKRRRLEADTDAHSELTQIQ